MVVMASEEGTHNGDNITTLNHPYDREDNIVLKPINISPDNEKQSVHPRFWCGHHGSSLDNSKDVYNYGISPTEKDKTPMCQIAEMARFHKLKHEYKLMDESGPAHKKLFTVQLVLTENECYEGSGASIKKAQQAAAAEALKMTSIQKPPERTRKTKKDESSPTVLLSHVCRRLEMTEPVYTMNSYYPPKGLMGRTEVKISSSTPSNTMNGDDHGKNGIDKEDNGISPIKKNESICAPLTPRSILAREPTPSTTSLNQTPPTLAPPTPTTVSSIPSLLSPTSPSLLFGHHHGSSPPLGPHHHHHLPNRPVHMCTLVMGGGHLQPVHAVAETKNEARNQAATQALFLLGPALAVLEKRMKEEKEEQKRMMKEEKRREREEKKMINEGDDRGVNHETNENAPPLSSPPSSSSTSSSTYPRQPKPKSVISQVHECALQMKLTVEFEVISEDGKAHERKYVVECRLRGGEMSLNACGTGRKKNEAKQAACAELVEKLKTIESSPLFIASTLFKSQRRSTQKPGQAMRGETKRKTIVKDMKMDPSYGHQIQPVSRLIQVMQARGEPEPRFEHLGETGQYKYRQFIVQVQCGDLQAEGAGPNKRLAKRAAAEEMLEMLGVAKPLPEPGKSLLKRRDGGDIYAGTMMTIGVFDPNELTPPPPVPLPPPPPPPPSAPAASSSVKWSDDSFTRDDAPAEGEKEEPKPRRRVTFNAQVAACTAPDDVSYPSTEVGPLKADDLGCAGKARRRGKEGRIRSLNDAQKIALGRSALAWIEGRNEEEDNVFRVESIMAPPFERDPAKTKLDKLGTTFGFNAHYTIFPQGELSNTSTSSSSSSSGPRSTPPSSTSMNGSSSSTMTSSDSSSTSSSSSSFFVIVNIPFQRPIMGEGCGPTIDIAYENAASDALHKIAVDPSFHPPKQAPPPMLYRMQPSAPPTSGGRPMMTPPTPTNMVFIPPSSHQPPVYQPQMGGVAPPTISM